MANIYVVGSEGSFTWLASRKRFGKKHKLLEGGNQEQLLKKLSRNNINRIKAPSVAPIWNSNSGTVILDQKTKENLTAGTLKGDAGTIIDLWGGPIEFGLGVNGKKLSKDGKIYSVVVAKHQCSDFLEKNDKNDKFDSDTTTNIACRKFLKNGKNGDGLLCSIDLLKKHRITIIEGDFANPFNYTVFFGLNKYPARHRYVPKVSLGCFLMDLQGQTELPPEFISHWNAITKSKGIISSKDILQAMPKIIFILRFNGSKALMLMEMPAKTNLKDPWIGPSGDSIVNSFGQVGLLNKSFAVETSDLMSTFRAGKRKVIFYGRKYVENNITKENYFWICPTLNISVHGFEPELVKNCAKIQVIRFSNLLKEGLKFPDEAVRILRQFDKNETLVKLATDSKPEGQ